MLYELSVVRSFSDNFNSALLYSKTQVNVLFNHQSTLSFSISVFSLFLFSFSCSTSFIFLFSSFFLNNIRHIKKSLSYRSDSNVCFDARGCVQRPKATENDMHAYNVLFDNVSFYRNSSFWLIRNMTLIMGVLFCSHEA